MGLSLLPGPSSILRRTACYIRRLRWLVRRLGTSGKNSSARCCARKGVRCRQGRLGGRSSRRLMNATGSVRRVKQRTDGVLVDQRLVLFPTLAVCALSQFPLARLQRQDFFFHRAFGDQLVDEYRLVLADSVGAIGGLVFDGRIPPRVVVDDSVGLDQVQPHAAGLEAEQEQGDFAVAKALDGLVALASLAGQLGVSDAALVQFRLDQAQHAREL